jgi:uncharacterized damage-inducible protein DinB
MPLQFTTSYIEDSLSLFRYYKSLAERAIAQVSDESLYAAAGPEANSIAVTVKHIAGNLRSRWTDFLTTDGENPPATRQELLAAWDAAWQTLFDALEPLTDADLARTVTIRGEPHSVMQAINRQLAHYTYHIGQIVHMARDHAGANWRSLTIPRGKSQAFNAKVQSGQASQR